MKKRPALKKKTQHRSSLSSSKRVTRTEDRYVVLVRSWVFLVLFAFMLGIGVVVGNYLNAQINGGSPTVAGVSTDR